MGNKRSEITKKVRFEVFKRDKFTCQYCGRMAPDVVLEVDHIKPIAEGGNNGMLNLITSCRDCNRGKGKVRLSDDQEVKKQQEELRILAEKREQLKMMMDWRMELSSLQQEEVEYVCDYWYVTNGTYSLNDRGRAAVMDLLKQFSIQEILDAIDIALAQYYKGDQRTVEKALTKVGGICYNRKKARREAEQNGNLQDREHIVLD